LKERGERYRNQVRISAGVATLSTSLTLPSTAKAGVASTPETRNILDIRDLLEFVGQSHFAQPVPGI
jgi:hypothetical protein